MNELDRLKTWMAEENVSISHLAAEMGIPYINAYMCIEKRKILSANFERHFRRRFGSDVADQIFASNESNYSPQPTPELA